MIMMTKHITGKTAFLWTFAVFALLHSTSATTTNATKEPEIAPALGKLFSIVKILEGEAKSRSTTAPGLDTTPSVNKSITTSPYVTVKPRRLRYHRQIYQQCLKIPNYRLREDCKNTARDPLIFAMSNMTRAYANVDEEMEYMKELREQKFRDCKPNCGDRRALSLRSLPKRGFQDCEAKCPSVAEWLESKTENIRSTSPWKYCRHYDPDRIPQWLNQAKCLCLGCIDPKTGKEDRNYISSPMKTSLRVLRKNANVRSFSACTSKLCLHSFDEFTIGCHCYVPSITS